MSYSGDSTPHSPWRVSSYPVQTWSDDDKTVRWSTISGQEQPKLPKTIRAVQDSHSACQGRTIVVCLDGTGDSFDNDNSNVVHFVGCLKKDDPRQVTYYQSGIGTYSRKGLSSGFSAGVDSKQLYSPIPILL